jgi:septal ring factor EnvC (AmiA/AmiB activator)
MTTQTENPATKPLSGTLTVRWFLLWTAIAFVFFAAIDWTIIVRLKAGTAATTQPLDAAITSIRGELAKLQAETTPMTNDWSAQRQEVAKSKDALATIHQELAASRTEYATMHQAWQEMKAQVTTATADLKDLRERLQANLRHAEEFERQLKSIIPATQPTSATTKPAP